MLAKLFENTSYFLASNYLLLFVSVSCFGYVFVNLIAFKSDLPKWLPGRLLAWAVAFSIAASFGFNVMTQDFWLSVVWGRMVDLGINPFNVPYLPALSQDIPLDHPHIRMTYGPLWAVISGIVTAVSFGSPIISWILFKATLLASWIGSLFLITNLTRESSSSKRCWAILVVGWLPLGFDATAHEGHNDITMMFFALLWLRELRAGRLRASSIALACSILIKYTTAPLLIAHLLYIVFKLKPSWRIVRRDSAPAIGGLLVVALWFVWSGSYHNGAASMVEWKFLGPSDFIRGVAHLVGIDLRYFGQPEALFGAAFFLMACWSNGRFAKAPNDENFGKAIVSIACLTTFVLVGHVWPWFIIWCLIFVGLVPDFWLSWFVVGVAAVAPFSIVHWWRTPGDDGFQHSQLPALLMYGTALLMVVSYFVVKSRLAYKSAWKIDPLEGDQHPKLTP